MPGSNFSSRTRLRIARITWGFCAKVQLITYVSVFLQPPGNFLGEPFLFKLNFITLCVDVLCTCMAVRHMHAVPYRPDEHTGSLWNWSYGWLCAIRWMLGNEPGSSAGASALKRCTISPAPRRENYFQVPENDSF